MDQIISSDISLQYNVSHRKDLRDSPMHKSQYLLENGVLIRILHINVLLWSQDLLYLIFFVSLVTLSIMHAIPFEFNNLTALEIFSSKILKQIDERSKYY